MFQIDWALMFAIFGFALLSRPHFRELIFLRQTNSDNQGNTPAGEGDKKTVIFQKKNSNDIPETSIQRESAVAKSHANAFVNRTQGPLRVSETQTVRPLSLIGNIFRFPIASLKYTHNFLCAPNFFEKEIFPLFCPSLTMECNDKYF